MTLNPILPTIDLIRRDCQVYPGQSLYKSASQGDVLNVLRRAFATMQGSPYSLYNEAYMEQLGYIYLKCGLKGPTQIPASVLPDQKGTSLDCGTDEWYTTNDAKETCDWVSLNHRVSSAAHFNANQYRLSNCNDGTTIDAGTKLCIPGMLSHLHPTIR
jgi:hypothetical protein